VPKQHTHKMPFIVMNGHCEPKCTRDTVHRIVHLKLIQFRLKKPVLPFSHVMMSFFLGNCFNSHHHVIKYLLTTSQNNLHCMCNFIASIIDSVRRVAKYTALA